MLIETAASRLTDPNASYSAETHINKSGVRARHQQMTVKAVEMFPGLTSLELSEKTRICRYLLARRLPECQTARKVIRGQERRCSVSKRLACTWYPQGSQIQDDIFNREKVA